jgi:hypothetical protein
MTTTLHRRAKIVAAVATAVVTVNLAGTALAATEPTSGDAPTSTTVPARAGRGERTGDRAARRAALEAFRAAMAEYAAQRKEIAADFRAAVQAAVAAADAAGKTDEAKATMRAAIAAAKSARDAALAALGPRPERPARS